jgi:ferric-dicitrate binding protein FerR (iron transport regulator)
MTDRDERTELEERLAEILDGDAPQEVYDAIAESDELRDLLYEAERAVGVARDCSSDYVPPPDLEARIMAALDKHTLASTAIQNSDEPTAGRQPVVPSPDAVSDGTRARPLELSSDEQATSTGGDAGAVTEPTEKSTGAPEAGQPASGDSKSAATEKIGQRGEAKLRELATRRRVKVGVAAAVAAAAAAVAAIFALRVGGPSTPAPSSATWSGKVAHVSTAGGEESGLEVCDPQGEACRKASEGSAVPAGSVLATDPRTRAHLELEDGTGLSLDRSTRLALLGNEPRAAKLERGAIVADVGQVEGTQARIEVPLGKVEVVGTKFAVRATEDATAVDVSRGTVRLSDHQARSVLVHAGEEGQLYEGTAPFATSAVALGEALAWSESALERQPEEVVTRGLGELKAKKPGAKQEQKGAVTLTSHSVKIRVSGAVARTEIDETFTNHTGDVLEGIYRFPLPPDAQIERLALEVNGKLEEGAFVDRDRASAIWRGAIVHAAPKLRRQMQEEIVWVPGPWRDPALLEWQRGGRFELRIYPIPKNGSRRVVLAYTQVITPTGGVRRYSYPLAHDPGMSTKVDRFSVDLQVRGHDGKFGVRTYGYELHRDGSTPEVETLRFSQTHFVPNGDLTVEYALPNRTAELTAWTYRPTPDSQSPPGNSNKSKPPGSSKDEGAPSSDAVDDHAPFVALALHPRLPRITDAEHRDIVLVVDSSRSMYGESFRRAAALSERIVREMDRLDRFTLLACDTTCRHLPGGMQPPSQQAAGQAARFLKDIEPEGASDITAVLGEARAAAGRNSKRSLRIVYLGDGTPTVGPIRPAYVTRAVRQALPAGGGTLTAVAIGADSDLDTLRAVARGGGGVVLPYSPGQSTSEAAYAVLGAAYGTALRDVEVTLPDGLSERAPRQVDTIPAGGESIVVARMTQPNVSGAVVLKGKVGTETFEQRYPVKLAASTSTGNAFVPRLYAATRIRDLERDPDAEAKKEAIRWSGKYNVASRHTSLLVLESPAMFKAFGLDNTRRAPDWSGEEESESTLADGEYELDEGEDLARMAGGAVGRLGAAKKRRRSSSRPGDPLSADMDFESSAGWGGAARAPAAAPKPSPPRTSAPSPEPGSGVIAEDLPPQPPRWRPQPRPRPMIPMRRVWDRKGTIKTDVTAPKTASLSAVSEAEREMERNPNRRDAVKKLYKLYALASEVDQATRLADRWSEKEPLDAEALTARADMAARNGKRERAIRILGSVVDVRPGDVKAQRRLARLHRWAGRPAVGCRHWLAVAQLRTADAKSLFEAVRCGRGTGESEMVDDMLGSADEKVKRATEALLGKAKHHSDELRGDLRLEATWSGGGHDLDLALLHPDGHRVSWLGAPTRSVITATDVTSDSREGLALRGGKPGEYVIEIVRAQGSGPVSGTVQVTAASTKQSIPFTLDGNRVTLGVARIRMQSRLVPLRGR